MAFEKIVPQWNAAGTEPPEDLKNSGFTPGYKPPAAFFNWYWTGMSKAVAELQEKAANAEALQGHMDDKTNPHGVTVEQLGIGNLMYKTYRIPGDSGWYRIGEIPPDGTGLVMLHKGYETSNYSNAIFAYSRNACLPDGVSIAQLGANIGANWLESVRIVYNSSLTNMNYLEIKAGVDADTEPVTVSIYSLNHKTRLLDTAETGSIPDGFQVYTFKFESGAVKANKIIGDVVGNVVGNVVGDGSGITGLTPKQVGAPYIHHVTGMLATAGWYRVGTINTSNIGAADTANNVSIARVAIGGGYSERNPVPFMVDAYHHYGTQAALYQQPAVANPTQVNQVRLYPIDDSTCGLDVYYMQNNSNRVNVSVMMHLGSFTPAALENVNDLTEEARATVTLTKEGNITGITEVSADIVTAGTLAGQVKANAEAVTDLTVAQVRNIVCGTADVADVLDSLNVGDLYFTVEEAT